MRKMEVLEHKKVKIPEHEKQNIKKDKNARI